MKRLLFQLQKEFLQIKRNPILIRIIFIMPIVQLVLLAYAATFELKKAELVIVDMDKSTLSKKIINRINHTKFFNVVGVIENSEVALKFVDEDYAYSVLVIPNNFEKNLVKNGSEKIQIMVNAINGVKAGLTNLYLNSIIQKINKDFIAENFVLKSQKGFIGITTDYRNWYNPEEDYKIFMVPGILVILVTMLAMVLSALNIVREKEIGTIEQLNVTPITKFQFLAGKLIPFWVISLIVLMFGMIFARIVFSMPIEGNPLMIFAFANLYIITVLGLGMFISTISSTQQQAMFSSFFFMITFILMSGLFTPIENMPNWAQSITLFNPLAYFIKFLRMVMLKGSYFNEVQHLFKSMILFALVTNLLAVLSYRKTTGEFRIKNILSIIKSEKS